MLKGETFMTDSTRVKDAYHSDTEGASYVA